MANSVYISEIAAETSKTETAHRHPLLVRITHWVFTLSFFGLVVSGIGIIYAHPHFYWGEAGNLQTPALFSLPIPTILGGPSGWGRSLHFQSAWFAILSGLLYVISGVFSRHFGRQLIPTRDQLSWSAFRSSLGEHLRFRRHASDEPYNVLQRLSYLAVVFVVFPLTIFSGFAMSPSITSVFPSIVIFFGGHQSARTIHFVLANLLFLFLIVHVVMISMSGFVRRMRSMITGGSAARKELQ